MRQNPSGRARKEHENRGNSKCRNSRSFCTMGRIQKSSGLNAVKNPLEAESGEWYYAEKEGKSTNRWQMQQLLGLLDEQSYRTADSLAEMLGVSEKTTRSRLKELDENLKACGAPARSAGMEPPAALPGLRQQHGVRSEPDDSESSKAAERSP